jgi:lysyl-tRNA synthetase class 2
MEFSQKELRKKKLIELLPNPFQHTRFARTTNIYSIINRFSQFNKEQLANEKVSIAGRIMRKRMIFADLTDQSGTIQLKFDSKNKKFKKLDRGDIIGIKGIICRTDKGQLSIEVKEFILLSKCLKLLPSSYFGLKDTEERFRNRHLDFIINERKRDIFFIRHQVIKGIRQFLEERDFMEIETPILVSEASGAQAKPFTTYHNKLDRNFYLRIATEIPLKKLLVSGFEKIYEIGRIFRNEGIDARHNPEFTTIEVYQAYENAEYMMNLTEELLHYLAKEVLKKGEFKFKLREEESSEEVPYIINFQTPFRRISMIEAIKEHTNIDFVKINNLEEALELAKNHNLKLEKFQKTIGHIILAFFEEFVEKKLIQPTFIYDYPIEVSPLAKSKLENKNIADRFELYIGGLEFANGYSELNDPIEQRKRFEEQTKQKELGNEEIASFDKEFIKALEYGMPPAGGLGIGIDRLIMLFTGQSNIKEVIAFPQLKTEEKEKWWNEDMRIKTETGVPDLPIFLLNANLEKNRDWIYFVLLNFSKDKEEAKIRLLRLFFLARNFPEGMLVKKNPKEVEAWKKIKESLDNYWITFNKQEGLYQHYQLERKKTKFRLLFNRKNSEIWKEWETLSKASFAYNFHLLGEVICNAISFFSETGKIEKLPTNEEAQFKVEFDIEPEKVPDILITSEKEKLGIEVVEISSFLSRNYGNLEKFVPSRVEGQVEEFIRKQRKEKIKELFKDVKEITMDGQAVEYEKELKKWVEEKGKNTFSLSFDISKKINNLNYLIEKLKERIKTKDKSWERKKFDNVALWTILSAYFSIYLYHAEKGYQVITDQEIQKDFLSWLLLKKIYENLNDVEIKKFDFLIITFLNAEYCNENSLLNKHDPLKKMEWELTKEKSKILKHISLNEGVKVVIPSLYIPIRSGKIKNLEGDLKEMERRFEKKWGFNISLIKYEEFGFDNYIFCVQNLEE